MHTAQRAAVPRSRGGSLLDVTATSARNAWAVGYQCPAPACAPLTLHWNGTAWTRVRSPNPTSSPRGNWLFAVSALPGATAWHPALERHKLDAPGLTTARGHRIRLSRHCDALS